jgi:hypothetical protein
MSGDQTYDWGGFGVGDRVIFEVPGETIVGRVVELVEPLEVDGSCMICNLRVAELPVSRGHRTDRVFLVSSADCHYSAS